jgi:hypothetical protein
VITSNYNIQLPNFELLEAQNIISENDYVAMARIIVKGITSRIRDKEITAEGQPLDENSIAWQRQKLRKGRSTRPLQYRGVLREPSSYQLVFEENTASITLIPSETQIHLDLIDISLKTGKNYADWFGIHEDDIKEMEQEITNIIAEKLSRV